MKPTLANKDKYYLDLEKCSEEEGKKIGVLLRKYLEKIGCHTNIRLIEGITYEGITYEDKYLCFSTNFQEWRLFPSKLYKKTELTYSEFVGMFEGDEVETFVQRMEKEMQANAHKGDWREFAKKENRIEILDEIRHHYDKLVKAFESDNEELIREHSADIGNIAMFMYESTKH